MLVFAWVSSRILKEWAAGKAIQPQWPALLIGITVLIRIPALLINEVTNIDEAQTIAHALTLIRSPEPWKSIDFTTNGPLNAYVFYIAEWLGLPIDYLVSHVILAVLEVILCVALFETARNWIGRQAALVMMIPLLLFMGFVQGADFIHQSSEIWCATALSSALALFSRLTRDPQKRTWKSWLLIGLLLGMVPFGKPQGAPPALMATLGIYAFILLFEKGRSRISAIAALTAGGLVFLLIFAGLVAWYDAWQDFVDLYIKANLNYAALYGKSLALIPSFLWGWGRYSGISMFFWLTVLLLGAGIASKGALSQRDKWVGILLLGIAYGGAYAVERAGRPFGHYLILYLFPGAMLLLGWSLQQLERARYRGYITAAGFLFLAGYVVLANRESYRTVAAAFSEDRPWELKMSPAARFVKQWVTDPDDYITVYGYYNELYVETQLPSATRTVTVYQHSAIWPELYTPYYCRDLMEKQPVVFVDALDTPLDFRQTFVNSTQHSFERIPELRRFLHDHYQLVKVIDRNRIYVRNDRLAEITGLEAGYKELGD